MNTTGRMLVFFLLSTLARADDVQINLFGRALKERKFLSSDLEKSTLGKAKRDVLTTSPSKATMLDDPSDQYAPSDQYGPADQYPPPDQYPPLDQYPPPPLDQYPPWIKVEQEAQNKLQDKLGDLDDQITWDLLRPAMKKSFECSLKCIDPDSGSADKLNQCMQDCQQPVQDFQQTLQQQYLDQIMQQTQQCEYCQQDATQNTTQLDTAHCVADCMKKIGKQIPDYKGQIEKLMKQAMAQEPDAHI